MDRRTSVRIHLRHLHGSYLRLIMDTKESVAKHRELVAEGWVRRFTAEEPRLSEAVESYRMIGLEVRVEPGALGEEQECRTCLTAPGFQDKYGTIYTRGSQESASDMVDDLFD